MNRLRPFKTFQHFLSCWQSVQLTSNWHTWLFQVRASCHVTLSGELALKIATERRTALLASKENFKKMVPHQCTMLTRSTMTERSFRRCQIFVFEMEKFLSMDDLSTTSEVFVASYLLKTYLLTSNWCSCCLTASEINFCRWKWQLSTDNWYVVLCLLWRQVRSSRMHSWHKRPSVLRSALVKDVSVQWPRMAGVGLWNSGWWRLSVHGTAQRCCCFIVIRGAVTRRWQWQRRWRTDAK